MDPYKVLGVSQDAQIQEIRQAHRKLILKCHPDKVQDPQQKAIKQDEFQRVQEAYEILSDEVQREKYDDQIKLAELRRQYQNKPNTSAPRSTKYPDIEIRTAEPRSKSYRDGPPPPPQGVKVAYAFSRSHDETRGPRYYEPDVRMPRRGESYHEPKPSKREAEKEREKKDEKERRKRKEAKEREKEREKRERDEEDARRAAKKEEKRQRERKEAKEKKLSKEEKRRDREPQHPYIEEDLYDEPQPIPRKSSRKHEDPRERSSGRDEFKLRRAATDTATKVDAARAYINSSRDVPGVERSQSYHGPKPPAAPTPPPTAGGVPIFPVPEDEAIHRSSARPRRGSADAPYVARERPMHRSSQDPIREDPNLAHDSPAARNAARYAEPPMGSSPPRGISRTHTMPIPVRPGPPPRRAETFAEDRSVNRGRGRSKMHAQYDLDESEEEYYEEPRHSGKHRSSRKTRSPEHPSAIRYKVTNNKTTVQNQQYYGREAPERSRYYGDGYSYEPARSHYPAYKESKPIRADDVQFSTYHTRGPYGTAQA
ncbi:DnaJ domain-containing protein [Emericellopsis atlantica]|uniref:DnaJ domain-containing protein n=1 Tax=Emericellopsis atlantica TaxID=2614577 RepID=A0A9P7ZK02_9HYPO|nr:DnaJ domain-containing protein [Emericellopsis atlantica]KAG9253131.1 DnaJ domain-containing protein [Emericellopsis atlantica]